MMPFIMAAPAATWIRPFSATRTLTGSNGPRLAEERHASKDGSRLI